MAIKLPDNLTAEQFARLEPKLIEAILEQYYIDGITQISNYRLIRPGSYQGEFRDGKKRFSFNINGDRDTVTYKPINKEEIQ